MGICDFVDVIGTVENVCARLFSHLIWHWDGEWTRGDRIEISKSHDGNRIQLLIISYFSDESKLNLSRMHVVGNKRHYANICLYLVHMKWSQCVACRCIYECKYLSWSDLFAHLHDQNVIQNCGAVKRLHLILKWKCRTHRRQVAIPNTKFNTFCDIGNDNTP